MNGNSATEFFSARQHICYSALYAIARPSVRLSITRVDQSKMVEVTITQPSPQSSPMTSFPTFNFTVKFHREVQRQETRVMGLLCGEGCVILTSTVFD